MAIAGLRGTGNWGTDERPKNFREMILWLSPNGTTPLTALMAKMPKTSVDDPEFSWWEETLTIGRFQLNDGTNMTATDTTFTIDNGVNGFTAQDLKAGDLVLVEEGAFGAAYAWEIVEVTSITSATVFEGARGAANTTAAGITDGTWMTVIGSAYEEGTAAATATTRNPTKSYNYTQIFKDSYAVTGTAKATRARTGDVVGNDKKRKMFDHAQKQEMAYLFGKRYETTGSGGKPKRYTGGLLFFLAAASRVDTATAMVGVTSAAIATLFSDLEDVFDYTGDGNTGGDERLILCGNGAMSAISKAAAAAGEVNFGEIVKVYGMNVTRLTIPQGSFYLKTHPLMNQHAVYTNSAFVIDPPGVKYRNLTGRDTKFEDNIQTPGKDSQEGQWRTEAGTEFHHLETMKYLHNITYATA